MNRNLVCSTLLAVLLFSAPVWAGGTVEEATYYSDALGADRTALVYLPEGYDTSDLSYPVLYYLGGVERMVGHWGSPEQLHPALDHLIGDGLIDPMIAVEIDPGNFPWAPDLPIPVNSFLIDSELNGFYETSVIEDLVPWIDAGYRTVPDRDNRFIAARCVGSLGAARLALANPELFRGYATNVGSGAVETLPYMAPLILSEYPDGPPYDFNPTTGQWSYFLFMWSAAITPNLTNPPWLVDLVIDRDGNLVPEVFDRYLAAGVGTLAADFATTGMDLDIYMLGGLTDDFYLPQTMIFASNLDAAGVPYVLRFDEGDHDDPADSERFHRHITFFMPLNATVELSPRILSGSNWWPLVEAAIELPGDLDVADIVTSTLAITQINGDDLEQPLRALIAHDTSDVNGNGRDDLTVWFWKPLLLRRLTDLGIKDHESFDITIEGETINGWFLAATDEQRAVNMAQPEARNSWWPLAVR